MKIKFLSAITGVAALVLAMLFAPVANAEPDEQMDIFVDGTKVASKSIVNMGQDVTLKFSITQSMLDSFKEYDSSLTKIPEIEFRAFDVDKTLDLFSTDSIASAGYGVGETVEITFKPSCRLSGRYIYAAPSGILRDEDGFVDEIESLKIGAYFHVADPDGLCDGQRPSITIVDSQGNTRSDFEHVKYGDTVKYHLPKVADGAVNAQIRLENPMWDETLQDEIPHIRDNHSQDLKIGESLNYDFSIGCKDSDGVDLMPGLAYTASFLVTPIQTAGSFELQSTPDILSIPFTIDDDYENCTVGNVDPAPGDGDGSGDGGQPGDGDGSGDGGQPGDGDDSDDTPSVDEPFIRFFDANHNSLVSVKAGEEFVITFNNAPEGSVGSATLYSTPKDLGSVVLKNGFGQLKATVPCSVEPGEHTIKAVIKDKLGKVLVRGERKVKVLKSNKCNESAFVGLKTKPAASVEPSSSKSAKSGSALAKTGSDAAALAWWASMMFAAAAGVYIARRQRA